MLIDKENNNSSLQDKLLGDQEMENKKERNTD